MSVQIGDKAPEFELFDQAGSLIKLGDLIANKNVVLFFYPKDNTPGCTREACAFRDSYEVFQENGADVIGVSSDSLDSHTNFIQQNKLPFTLLSDKGGKVRKLFGVPKTFGFIAGRVTYVIDKQGIIKSMFNSQLNFNGHIEQTLRILKSINNN